MLRASCLGVGVALCAYAKWDKATGKCTPRRESNASKAESKGKGKDEDKIWLVIGP